MYSLAAPMDALYSSAVTVRAASAFGSPGGGAATIGRGSEPSAGPGAVRRQLDQPRAGGLVGRRHGRRCRRGHRAASGTTTLSTSTMRWRQWSKAQNWPMTTSAASGWPRSSSRHVGQPLDLAHHVVAEIPDQPSVQRRQPGAATATGSAPPAPPPRPGCPSSESARPRRPGGRDVPAPCRERGQRPAPHERVAAPALAALDGLEEEAVLLPHDVGEAGHRASGCRRPPRTRPARSCAPWPARRTRRGRGGRPGRPPTPRGPGRLRRSRRGHPRARADGPEEAASAPRCGRPRGRAGPPGRPARRRHSPSAPRARTGGRPTSRPSASTPGGSGCRTRCARSRACGAAPRASM